MFICFVIKDDCVVIVEIYNYVVVYIVVIWNDKIVDIDNCIVWFEVC